MSHTPLIAPYAPVTNVLTVIQRFRERGLPEVLSTQELQRLGIPEGNAPRTLQALRFLGLVNEEGNRTELFNRLGRASTDEYPQVLAEIVRAAYAPVFTIVDPAQDDDIAIHDAFRQYEPKAQRERMVTLFLGLCREALIIPGHAPQHRKTRTSKKATPVRKEQPTPRANAVTDQGPKPSTETHIEFHEPDYRLLSALIQQLPKGRKWSKSHRERWIQALTASVDLLIECVEEDAEKEAGKSPDNRKKDSVQRTE